MSKFRILDLQNGQRGLIDEDDWHLVKDLTPYLGTNGYVYYSTWRHGRSWPKTLHSLLVGAVPGMHVDHVNGDKTDNRRCNLRHVTPQQNQVNRHRTNRNNTSGVRGVTVRLGARNPYIAQIMVNRKTLYLGSFPTLETAKAARRAAELLHFGKECP